MQNRVSNKNIVVDCHPAFAVLLEVIVYVH